MPDVKALRAKFDELAKKVSQHPKFYEGDQAAVKAYNDLRKAKREAHMAWEAAAAEDVKPSFVEAVPSGERSKLPQVSQVSVMKEAAK